MATYEETMKTIEEMRSRFSSGFSSSDKSKIEELYLLVCGKRVRNLGCADCYRDAFIEIRMKLKQLKAMPKKPNYILKAGVIIHPQGTSKYYSLNNIPDDVAEEWLGKFPQDITSFETYPTDWESRVQARKDGTVHVATYDELKEQVEKNEAEQAEKDAKIEALEGRLAEVEGELAAANEQIEAGKKEAQEEVERLNGVIADKEAEIAAAKEAAAAGAKEATDAAVAEAVAAAKKEVTDAMNKAIAESKKELLTAKDTIAKKDAEIEQLKGEIAKLQAQPAAEADNKEAENK